jgi:hypothetical protein
MNKLLLLVIFFTVSCNIISKNRYGIKKQRVETPERINDWLISRQLNTENIFTIVPEYWMEYSLLTQNAPLLFDKHSGRFLAVGFTNGKFDPVNSNKLFADILPYPLLNVKPDSFLISRTTIISEGYSLKDKGKFSTLYDTTYITLNNIRQVIRTLKGAPVTVQLEEDVDYILIIPFALYLGNKEQTKAINQYYYSALANRFSKIRILFLNLDKQEWWTDQWKKTNSTKYK